MYKLIVFCLITLTMGCKSDQEKKGDVTTEEVVETPQKMEKSFVIKLNVQIPNDDVLEVYFQDQDNDKYSWKNKVTKNITGSTNMQTVEFKLPNEIFPTSIRIDLGAGKESETIAFGGLEMSFEDFNMTVNQEELPGFFIPNKYIQYNKETGEITCTKVEGKYDPYFDSKPVFKKKLEIEAR